MKLTRRKLLLMLALLAAADYGRSVVAMGVGTPAGWKTERWQAGFGSWASGGYGVAYDISMPQDYDFQQKCGTAWIADDLDGPDFVARLSFRPDAKQRQQDFASYLKEDAGRNYEADGSALSMAGRTDFNVGALRFSRLDFALDNAKAPGGAGSRSAAAPAGFWLDGEKLSIVFDLRDAVRSEIDQRIIRSIRKASGYGVTEILSRTIPGLMGC